MYSEKRNHHGAGLKHFLQSVPPLPHQRKIPSELSTRVGIVGRICCHDERRSLVTVLCAAIQTVFVVVELQNPADSSTACLRGAVGYHIRLTGCGGTPTLGSIGRALTILSLLATTAGCQA